MTEAGQDRGAVIRAWVAGELRRRGWSQRQLASRAGIAPGGLNDFLNDEDRTPRATTIEKLEAVLGPAPGRGVPLESGLTATSPDDLGPLGGHPAALAMAGMVREAPERFALFLGAAAGCGFFFPKVCPVLILLDVLAPLESGDVLGVRSPLGDGLRYFADPYLIGPGGSDMGHEIRGAVGVQILGKVAAILSTPAASRPSP